jgi:hypothetical protein
MRHRLSTLFLILSALFAPAMRATAPAAPPSAGTTAARAAAAFAAKDWATAESAYVELVAEQPDNAMAHLRLGSSRLYLGSISEAERDLARAEALGAAAAPLHYRKACLQTKLGNPDAAIAELEQAVAAGFGSATQLESETLFEPLRGDTRFRKIFTDLDRQVRPCLYDQRYRQFDFWLGEWDVVPNGSPAGTPSAANIVTLEHDQCIVHEHWKGNSTGESFNLYDASRDAWFQTWVDSTGGIHEYRGGLDEKGNMIYTAELAPSPGQATNANGRVPTRLSFLRLGPDQVRQLSEQSTDGGKSWQVAYDLIYSRRPAKPVSATP